MDKNHIVPRSSITNIALIDAAKKIDPVVRNFLPTETVEGLRNGKTLTAAEFTKQVNYLYDTILNKIYKTEFFTPTIVDKLDFITTDSRAFGEWKEMIGVGLNKVYTFKPGLEYNPFIIENDDVRAYYTSENYQEYQRITLFKSDVQKMFTSANGLATFASKKQQSIRNTQVLSNYIKKQSKLKLLENEMAHVKVTSDITDETSARAFVKQLITLVRDASENTSDYNAANMLTSTDLSKGRLILLNKYEPILKIDMVVNAFNAEGLQLPPITWVKELGSTVVPHDEEGQKTGTAVGLIENAIGLYMEDGFMKHTITYDEFASQPNPEGRYINYFQHGDGEIGWDPFKTCVLFHTGTKTRPATTLWSKQRAIDNAKIEEVTPETDSGS